MMTLRKEIKRIVGLGTLAVLAIGCRSVGVESMTSSSAANEKLPYEGDPYMWGGIQEGTGGLVAASKQTMETETYSDPKFVKLAGNEGFVSMSGWSLHPARPNDSAGDYQPLPHQESAEGASSGAHGGEEGH